MRKYTIRKFRMITGLLLTILLLGTRSFAFELVDFAEIDRLIEYEYRSRAVLPEPYPEGPVIDVIRPESLAEPLLSPLDIEIHFLARPSSAVVPDSLRVYYHTRFFDLDVTDRLLSHARLSAESLLVEEAELRVGDHALSMVVGDTEGRRGTRRFVSNQDGLGIRIAKNV